VLGITLIFSYAFEVFRCCVFFGGFLRMKKLTTKKRVDRMGRHPLEKSSKGSVLCSFSEHSGRRTGGQGTV